MTTGTFQKEYEWAQRHGDTPEGKAMLDLAALYMKHQDAPTLGLIQGAADAIRKVMQR